MWIGKTDSSKYWVGLLNGLKDRSVSVILLISVDGLSEFSEAIAMVFPKMGIQRCIIHQIRSSTRYVSYKGIKAFTVEFNPIYRVTTEEEAALQALDELERVCGAKYPAGIKFVAGSLGRVGDHVQESGTDPKGDLNDQRHRKFKPPIAQGHKDEKRVCQRRRSAQAAISDHHAGYGKLDDADQRLGSNPDALDDLLRRSSQRDALMNNTVMTQGKDEPCLSWLIEILWHFAFTQSFRRYLI